MEFRYKGCCHDVGKLHAYCVHTKHKPQGQLLNGASSAMMAIRFSYNSANVATTLTTLPDIKALVINTAPLSIITKDANRLMLAS